jgi:hypothetical protein
MSKRVDSSQPDLHANVIARLPAVVDNDDVLSPIERGHVDSCLQCQAELVRYRKLLRALHDLRTNVIQPAPGLLADILDGLAERGERRAIRSLVTGRRAAYTGGIAVATIAGVTGVVLLAGRSRGRTTRKAA